MLLQSNYERCGVLRACTTVHPPYQPKGVLAYVARASVNGLEVIVTGSTPCEAWAMLVSAVKNLADD